MIIHEEHDLQIWEKLLSKADRTPLHSSKFLEHFKDEGREPIYLTFYEQDEVVGIIGGVEREPDLRIIRGIGHFKTGQFFSGPRFKKDVDHCSAYRALEDYLRKRGHARYTLMNLDHPNPIPDLGNGSECWSHCEFIQDLEGPWEDIQMKIKRKVRYKQRLGIRKGLRSEISKDPELVPQLFALIKQTADHRSSRGYADFNLSPIPFLSVEAIRDLVSKGCGRLGIARQDDEILSIELFIDNDKRAYSIFSGTSFRGYELNAPSFLTIEILERLNSEGLLSLNVGGNPRTGAEGLEQYKLSFGAKKVQTYGSRSDLLKGTILGKVVDCYRFVRKRSSGEIENTALV